MDIRLTTEELSKLASEYNGKPMKFNKKEIISGKNKSYGTFFILIKGMVYLCAENELYTRNILHFFRSGECFSSKMLIPISNGIDYFVAKYPSEILCFRHDDILKIYNKDDILSKKLIDMILGFSQETLIHSFILQQKSIRSKLLYFFKRECEIQASNKIHLPIPYSDLADYISADRTAIMKEISRMKEEGIIGGRNRDITICPNNTAL